MKTKISLLLLILLSFAPIKIFSQDNTKPTEVLITDYSSTILINKEFNYQIPARLIPEFSAAPIIYKLVNAPAKAVVDEKGIITWKPDVKGEYSIEAQAFQNTTKITAATIKLKVVEVIGSVTGSIRSGTTPLADGYAALYKKSTDGGKESYIVAYSGTTDRNGIYNITNVELGTYFLYATSKSLDPEVKFEGVYYTNPIKNPPATEINDATPITLNDAVPFKADFDLKTISQSENRVETTNYSAVILVNAEFKYQVTIKTLLAVQPTGYKLSKFPEGMTIDEKTGIIKWTPKTTGEFTAEAIAYLGESVIGNSIIKIKVVNAFGSVKGVVISDDGKPVQFGYITLYKKIVATGRPDSYSAAYSGSTDINGVYSIPNVELGTYIAYAMAKATEANVQYKAIYYVDAETADKATSFSVANSTPVEINFKLPKITVIRTEIISYSTSIKVGTEFSYQVKVKLPDGVTSANYMLTAKPDGMTIDEKTGLVKWTPKSKGEFGAQVTVVAQQQKLALINMKLTVFSFAGTVIGTVINEDKKPIPYTTITLLRKVSPTEKSASAVRSYSGMTDMNGKYSIANVDSAIYYVYANGGYEKTPISSVRPEAYQPVYYLNSETIDKATPVPVVTTTAVVIDFTLKKYVPQATVKASISGNVVNTSGRPVSGATITIIQTKPTSSNNNGADCKNYLISNSANVCSYSDVLVDARTDVNGNYSIRLETGNSYIVACSSPGFITQLYNGKTSLLEANKILLKKDTTNINFKLEPVPEAKASVSGLVVDSAKVPVIAKVVLYPASLSSKNDRNIRTVATSAKGEFLFEKVPNGKYYLQVIPLKDYIPAYYKMNNCGIRDTKAADIIAVENDASISNISVCVLKAKVTGGGKISGYIKNNYGEPIGGVIVIAESSTGGDLSFDISGEDGSYSIDNLGAGVYNVYGEKTGYTNSFTNNAVIDYSNNIFNSQIDLTVNPPMITEIKNGNSLPTRFELMQNYPNPFNPSTTITWQIIEASHVTLKVYDLMGREVVTLVDEFKQSGLYNSQFSIQNSQLASGVYYYTLKAGNNVITKKMLLVK